MHQKFIHVQVNHLQSENDNLLGNLAILETLIHPTLSLLFLASCSEKYSQGWYQSIKQLWNDQKPSIRKLAAGL